MYHPVTRSNAICAILNYNFGTGYCCKECAKGGVITRKSVYMSLEMNVILIS